VLQINFRGSIGYGKQFINAANREWGGAIQDDLTDGVNWAIGRRIADAKRIGIFGSAFGGYAALAGLAFTPDLYACAVDICGPSNLATFVQNLPPYMKPVEPLLWDRIGHPEKEAAFLKARSPLHSVDRIKRPLLIAQGANDPRVTKQETLQLVEALKKAGKCAEYVEYPDEGHGFAKPENRLDFYGRAEKFLADHLGGRFGD
jgi:dipeptidyl aminopeptidase/acylaminoacyl peptidase